MEGTIVEGTMNGPGTYTFPSGKIWEGNFVNNLF